METMSNGNNFLLTILHGGNPGMLFLKLQYKINKQTN